MTILDKIVASKRIQFPHSEFSSEFPFTQFDYGESSSKRLFENSNQFVQSLTRSGISIIGEVKPSSPSAGKLLESSRLDEILTLYKQHCAAVSVLTDKQYFGGSFNLLTHVKQVTGLPVLCKDFIISTTQIQLAKQHGADAILLIAKILETKELKYLVDAALREGLSPVVEINNRSDVQVISNLPVEVILINNRNLDTMKIDLDTTETLSRFLREDQIVISASGIKTKEDIQKLLPSSRRFLIGTSLMQSPEPGKLLEEFLTARLVETSETQRLQLLPTNVPTSAVSKIETSGSEGKRLPAQSDNVHMNKSCLSSALNQKAGTETPFRSDSVPQVKICGITNIVDAEIAIEAGAEFIGLIFAPSSKRKLTLEQARTIVAGVNGRAQIVGVFQNQECEEVNFFAEELNIDFVQLHGSEDANYAAGCVRRVIKTFEYSQSTASSSSLNLMDAQKLLEFSNATYFLFDLDKSTEQSRSEQSRDKISSQDSFPSRREFAPQNKFSELACFLDPIRDRIPPFFLAGELSPDNVQLAIETVRPFAIDVASGVEHSVGIKSSTLTTQFCNLAKTARRPVLSC